MVEKVLIPMYPRINMSFIELHDLGLSAAKIVVASERVLAGKQKRSYPSGPLPTLECRFIRGHRYIEECLFNGNGLNADQIGRLCEQLTLPRYAGLITVGSEVFGRADILLDSTTTGKNLRALCVVPRSPAKFLNMSFCRRVAEKFATSALVC